MTEELSREMFDALILHMSRCAKMYRAQAERAHRKSLLTTLFVSCDHTGVGRAHNILYDNSMTMKHSLSLEAALRHETNFVLPQI